MLSEATVTVWKLLRLEEQMLYDPQGEADAERVAEL
jgi:hypothetical protein